MACRIRRSGARTRRRSADGRGVSRADVARRRKAAAEVAAQGVRVPRTIAAALVAFEVLYERAFELFDRLPRSVDVGVGPPLLRQPAQVALVAAPERLHRTQRLVRRHADEAQRVHAHAQRCVQSLAVDVLDAVAEQFVGLVTRLGSDEHAHAREVPPQQRRDRARAFDVAEAQQDRGCATRAGCGEQFEAARVAVVDLEAHAPQQVDAVAVLVEHRRRHAARAQQPADRAAEVAEADDQHRRVAVHRVGGLRWRRFGRSDAAPQHAFVPHEQQRRGRHRQRDDGGQQVRVGGRQHRVLRREREQHEAELAALRQRQREQEALVGRETRPAAEPPQHRELAHDQHGDQRRHDPGALTDQREVDRRADAEEEQPEQQTLERFEVGFEFVAVFAGRQHDAGDEGAECRRQADELHQQRDADDEQQRRRREGLAQAGPRDDAERGRHQPAAERDDAGDGADRREPTRPAGPVRQRACVRVGARRRRRGITAGHGQQRQHRQQRDHRDVLEQQHQERALAAARRQPALLLQRLQHDRGRRHRQDQARRQRRPPGDAEREAARGEQQRGRDHLHAAAAEQRAAAAPQGARVEFEPDHEQHHDDAELRRVHDVGAGAAEEAEAERPDRDAGDQVAQYGAEPEPPRERHRDHGGGEVDERLGEEVHVSRPPPASSRRQRAVGRRRVAVRSGAAASARRPSPPHRSPVRPSRVCR